MRAFSYISVAEEDQFLERYRLIKKVGKGLRNVIIPHMPDYIHGTVGDIGVSEYNISGCWVCMPPGTDNPPMGGKRLERVLNRCRNFGADVLVINPEVKVRSPLDYPGFRISNGMLFMPFAFIDAAKSVSALMGIDFNRSNICIADASTEIGLIITELLLDEVSYLTLCTSDKESLFIKTQRYVLKSGLSPAVVSNYKKAVSSCDILIYTGCADMDVLTSYINRKVLIVNLTGDKAKLEKDLLMIEEVILKGRNEPVIRCSNIDQHVFLTSRMWEGALLTLCSFDTRTYSIENAYKIHELSNNAGLRIKNVVANGRLIDKYDIYNYR